MRESLLCRFRNTFQVAFVEIRGVNCSCSCLCVFIRSSVCCFITFNSRGHCEGEISAGAGQANKLLSFLQETKTHFSEESAGVPDDEPEDEFLLRYYAVWMFADVSVMRTSTTLPGRTSQTAVVLTLFYCLCEIKFTNL